MTAPVRTPPSDLDAEAAVLSTLLLSPDHLDAVRDILDPSDFYADANRRIYDAILAVESDGKPVDIRTVVDQLRVSNRLNQIGGTPYLAQLSDATPAVANVEAHAQIVASRARQRRMIELGHKIVAEGYEPIDDVEKWSQAIEHDVFRLNLEGSTRDAGGDLNALAPERINEIREIRESGGKMPGLETGFSSLTSLLQGYRRGKVYIVAARPGMGKSAFAVNTAVNIAKAGIVHDEKTGRDVPTHAVVIISAEMDKQELVDRMLASEGRVVLKNVMAGKLTDQDWALTVEAAETLRKLPIGIVHRAGVTVAEIRSLVRRRFAELRATFGEQLELAAVVIDYLQIMGGKRRDSDTRENEVSEISRGVLGIAGEFECAVIALSQLNRSLESRPDKRPQLSDLRESGSIEQDAYGIIFLYRDEYYNKDTMDRGLAEAIVAKHRNGVTGKAILKFTGEYTRFDTLVSPFDELTNDFIDNSDPDDF